MAPNQDFLTEVRNAAAMRILILPHAVRQMSRPDRMISPADVRLVIAKGELIENYPEDARGHSALLSGKSKDGRPVHVVCSPKDEYLAIITAYVPDELEWSDDWTRRRPK